MTGSLSENFLKGSVLVLLTSAHLSAQPIQLFPKAEVQQEIFPSFAPSRERVEKGFWEGTPPSIIEAYFPKLPTQLTSPVLQSLQALILKEKYIFLLGQPSYDKTEISLLTEKGDLDQAFEVLMETSLPDKNHFLLSLLWLQGKQKKACEKIVSLMHTSSSSAWKVQNTYCFYLEGEKERGKVALEFLKESHPQAFPLMSALFDSHVSLAFDSSLGRDPFLLTVWCALGKPIPQKELEKFSPSARRLVACAETMPLETRLSAGMKAFEEGNLSADFLMDLVKKGPKSHFLNKISQALEKPQVNMLLPLLKQASKDNSLRIIGRLFKPSFVKIKHLRDMLPLAPYMAHLFLEIQEIELAEKWTDLLKKESPEKAFLLSPFLHIASSKSEWGEEYLRAWQNEQLRLNPKHAAEYSYLLRHLLEALGEASGSPLRGEPSSLSSRQERTLFDVKALELLYAAASSQRKGETALLILTLVGNRSVKDLSPDQCILLVKSLYKGGFEKEARDLALEYLLRKL